FPIRFVRREVAGVRIVGIERRGAGLLFEQRRAHTHPYAGPVGQRGEGFRSVGGGLFGGLGGARERKRAGGDETGADGAAVESVVIRHGSVAPRSPQGERRAVGLL